MNTNASAKIPISESIHNYATGKQKILGHLALILFATLIAGSFSLGSIAIPYLEPAALNAMRFFIGAILIGITCQFVLPGGLTVPPAPWRFLVLGGIMAAYFVTMFIALQTTTPVATGAVFTLVPLMTAISGYLILRQKSKPLVLFALAVGAIGSVWVIFRGDLQAILGFNIGQGEWIYFIGCIGHAFYAPLIKRFNRGEPLLLFTFWTVVGIFLFVAAYGFNDILATDWASIPFFVWGVIAYLATFTTAVTLYLLKFASIRLPAAKVLAYGYLVPVVVILMEGLAGHGWTSMTVLVGAMVIVLGLVILVVSPDE
ncbi:MAG: DMT family transporter [Rhizobiaceae bacterium]